MKHLPLLSNSDINFLFIDDRQDRIDHLKSEINLLNPPNNFHLDSRVNEFENTLTQILDNLDQKGRQLAPTFAFIDPFGFKGASFVLTRRLLSNQSTEVFINIMIDFINRFVEHPSDVDRQHIRDLLGASEEEINNVISSSDRVLALRQLYQDKLRQYAKFVRYFEMRNDRNKVIYYLFFASNHPLGHAKMKEAFWKIDNQSGFKFSDRTDPNQPVLFELDPSVDLASDIKKQFNGTTRLSEDVINYVVDQTAYTESHCKKSLLRLESNSEITVEINKIDGSRRRKATFPTGVVINF